ncbi:MAG: hypothetical protein LDL56_10630 [Armatimonadetes bacterium]|nr:hypothetical protein [Armatimonadota bacterium]MCA1997667.1 hypothetical protein [Armatimonadota bacterium]
MAEAAEIWAKVLPEVRQGVTGVGVWAALNTCRPVTVEDGTLVLGLPHEETELAGHLRMPHLSRLIESKFGAAWGSPIKLRVIDGVTLQDWDNVKRRDAEARRLQERALEKSRAEAASRATWENVYEQLGRKYAQMANRSLPQNRARLLVEGVQLIAEARRSIGAGDELNERNFARCMERLAQHTDTPSALIAVEVLKAVGEL